MDNSEKQEQILRWTLEARLEDGRASGYPDPNACWIWQRGLAAGGYGRWSVKAWRERMAHRVVWRLLRGPIPEGMVLDHMCRNRACVNPAHLRVFTRQQNATINNTGITAQNAAKTECPRCGGPWAMYPYGKAAERGLRYCPPCHAEDNRENQRRRKAQGKTAPVAPPQPWCRKGLHRLVDDDGNPTKNLLVRHDGRRECRRCHADRENERRARLLSPYGLPSA